MLLLGLVKIHVMQKFVLVNSFPTPLFPKYSMDCLMPGRANSMESNKTLKV